MIFNSGWGKDDIWGLTYAELFDYVKIFKDHEAEKIFNLAKSFTLYNFESTSMAMHGKKREITKFLSTLRNRKLNVETPTNDYNIDDQFKGVGLGE